MVKPKARATAAFLGVWGIPRKVVGRCGIPTTNTAPCGPADAPVNGRDSTHAAVHKHAPPRISFPQAPAAAEAELRGRESKSRRPRRSCIAALRDLLEPACPTGSDVQPLWSSPPWDGVCP